VPERRRRRRRRRRIRGALEEKLGGWGGGVESGRELCLLRE